MASLNCIPEVYNLDHSLSIRLLKSVSNNILLLDGGLPHILDLPTLPALYWQPDSDVPNLNMTRQITKTAKSFADFMKILNSNTNLWADKKIKLEFGLS